VTSLLRCGCRISRRASSERAWAFLAVLSGAAAMARAVKDDEFARNPRRGRCGGQSYPRPTAFAEIFRSSGGQSERAHQILARK